MVAPVAPVDDTILPRRYQEEIFARAQEGNIIAALDTGSGKTFISTMLMKWIAARHADEKKIVFLVPKVALVEQQADFIARQTPLRVNRFHGAMSIEMTDRSKWRKEFEATDVLVITAQIFLNIITHSHWSMDKISLMIFDECHHCRKNHAYNGIMREYYQAQPGHRPKIFGMTASPIWNPKDAAESLATLERNMNAKVIAVREHAEELSEHLPKPNEIIVQYGRPAKSYPSYPGKLIYDQLRSVNIPTDWSIPWDRIESRYEVTKHSLGVFGAEYYLYAELRFRIGQLFTSADEATKLNMDVMLMAYSLPDYDTMVAPEFVPPSADILELDALLSRYTPLFGDVADATISTIDVQLEWCTPQVQELVKVLVERYTPSFQGIVFVEQRHVALALAKILPRLVTTKRIIRCAELVGHGASAATKAKIKGMAIQSQQDVVKQFRDGELNLLIATSVAEEGLDFPACDVVIRFDPIQHMVGYVQSRGRARQKTSTFIVMVQEGQQEALARYMAFAETEPQLKQYYQRQSVTQPIVDDELEEGEVEPDDPVDIAHRERYVVERTKATLTYHSAIGLLNHLCSLIPRDRFTPPQVPVYTGDFRSVLQLPSSLPLPPKYLTFEGPMRNSKKEAKRAVAFHAVKSLHQIGVFDDYLLPTRTAQEGDLEDAEGQFISDWGYIPELMSVNVRDPWTVDEKMWSHVIYVDENPVAGLVTGTRLYEADLVWNTQHIRIGPAKRVVLEAPYHQREIMHTYTRIGVCWSVTGRGVKLPFSCYLVPLTLELKPDWDTMEKTNEHPWGSPDWANIGKESYGHLLCMNNKEQGKPMLLQAIRHDLSPMSRPPRGSMEAEFETYRDYWISAYTRKGIPPEIPTDGPLVEAIGLTRQVSGAYSLTPDLEAKDDTPVYTGKVYLFPLSLARQMCMPLRMWSAFKLLPRILHRVTDVYRAHCARTELMLPSLPADLVIESYTLPSVGSTTNNQRLETLGDSVLKLGIVVQLYNRFPHRHEGQLDILRRSSVSNKTLLSRACDVDLARFLSGEPETMRAWRHVLPEDMDWQTEPRANRYAPRHIARNSMSDCMESSLGAAFATGGIDCALRMATTLNLALGGPIPWSLRYSRPPEPSPRSALFTELQRDRLQYSFHREELLLEALTHPSFKTDSNSSYQRLEFLGDALIDLVVMDYLYRKFPNADSGQLSWARSRAVCGPTLAFLAVQKLQLHKLLLVNNVELSIAIARYVPILQDISVNEIIIRGWKQDPPKALSDAFESTLGAMLVDCAWNYHVAAATIENVMADVLEVLTPDLPKDPVSEFMTWGARAGCQQIRFDKKTSGGDLRRSSEGISVVVHDMVVVGPLGGSNLSLAKGLAAERARIELDNPKGRFFLGKICTCHRIVKVEETSEDVKDEMPVDSAPSLVNGHKEMGETKAGLAGKLSNGARAHLAMMISPKVEHDTIVTDYSTTGHKSAPHMRMPQVDLDGDVNMDDDWSASSGLE